MSHGGLPPRRADQMDERTPRIPVPGARTTPIVNKPGTVVTVLQGGVPGMASASKVGVGPQAATGFFTFGAKGKIWGAHLSYCVSSNNLFPNTAINETYALVQLQSGFVLCILEQALSGPNQVNSGDGDPSFPGLPVAAGDKLQLDVNNGTVLGNALQRASVAVYYSIP